MRKTQNNSSNSLCKSDSSSLNKCCCGGGGDQGGNEIQARYNPYDSVPESSKPVSGRGDEEKEEVEEEAVKGAGSKAGSKAGCCHSEFVSFIDSMAEKRGSAESKVRYVSDSAGFTPVKSRRAW